MHSNLSLRDIYPELQSFPSDEEKPLYFNNVL